MERPTLSLVIPLYNAEHSIRSVVERIRVTFADTPHEIVLVNDGSRDQTERVARDELPQESQSIKFVQLSRNFGEHHAVLAGLSYTTGEFVAVLDDDGQNPPEEIPAMLEYLRAKEVDVVYGRYRERKHQWHRRLGSWFNDRMATLMLRKPPGLYLSSFKVMNRFIVNELIKYQGPYPYIDGLICRTTDRLAELEVRHDHRLTGSSGYTLRKLMRLWLNMFLGFSILPLRVSVLLGLITSGTSVLWLSMILIDKLWINPAVTVGIPTVLACMVLFSGVQLIVLGMIGEYVGRVFLAGNGQPQYVVRYQCSPEPSE